LEIISAFLLCTIRAKPEWSRRRRSRRILFIQWTSFGYENKHQFEAGLKIEIPDDTAKHIVDAARVELRKCRSGLKEQEFSFHASSTTGDIIMKHILTDVAVGSDSSTSVELDPVFEDEEFEGSKDYFRIRSSDRQTILVSGKFGEIEYADAAWHQVRVERFVHELPFSMWTFQKIDPLNETLEDEHVAWLERTSESNGIDFLEQLAPWHLLDVEREALKSHVKSRFRDLSRSFHPDKVLASKKKERSEKIFVLLQNAYEGLKNSDEKQKEQFRSSADTESQLFSHSRHVVELLPFHWTRVGNGSDARFAINATTTTHLNSTDAGTTSLEGGSAQVWLLFLYSARCSMSRAVEGFLDAAAGHLEKHENIKVGAYGCGLYGDILPTKTDLLGLRTDPICKQFQRLETPNIHVVVETLSGDDSFAVSNAKFKHFYAAVPTGNSTELYPQNLINFALTGRKIWNDSHLVRRMKKEDFYDPAFMTNVSVVAFTDSTDATLGEVQDAIAATLPALARRFLDKHLYVGIVSCGSGDDEDGYLVDCSEFGVGWLPDMKLFGANRTEGVSLIRGHFGDRRDVQIGKLLGRMDSPVIMN